MLATIVTTAGAVTELLIWCPAGRRRFRDPLNTRMVTATPPRHLWLGSITCVDGTLGARPATAFS